MVNHNGAKHHGHQFEEIWAELSLSSFENQFYERFDGTNGWMDGIVAAPDRIVQA
jgi:hypothetical protein